MAAPKSTIPHTGTWSLTAPMNDARVEDFTAVLLPARRVLVAGARQSSTTSRKRACNSHFRRIRVHISFCHATNFAMADSGCACSERLWSEAGVGCRSCERAPTDGARADDVTRYPRRTRAGRDGEGAA